MIKITSKIKKRTATCLIAGVITHGQAPIAHRKVGEVCNLARQDGRRRRDGVEQHLSKIERFARRLAALARASFQSSPTLSCPPPSVGGYNQQQMQDVLNKLDELINALRR